MDLCVFELNPEQKARRKRISFQIIGKKVIFTNSSVAV
jgi:hypothetical protein